MNRLSIIFLTLGIVIMMAGVFLVGYGLGEDYGRKLEDMVWRQAIKEAILEEMMKPKQQHLKQL